MFAINPFRIYLLCVSLSPIDVLQVDASGRRVAKTKLEVDEIAPRVQALFDQIAAPVPAIGPVATAQTKTQIQADNTDEPLTPSLATYCGLVEAWSFSDPARATEILNYILDKGMVPTVYPFRKIISAWSRKGNIEQCEGVFEQMLQAGPKLTDPISCKIVLRLLSMGHRDFYVKERLGVSCVSVSRG